MVALQNRLKFSCRLAALCLVLGAAQGCSSPVATPLPDSTQALKPVMSPADSKQAVKDLTAEQAKLKAAAEKARQPAN
jgi:hypothetical protein